METKFINGKKHKSSQPNAKKKESRDNFINYNQDDIAIDRLKKRKKNNRIGKNKYNLINVKNV